MAYATKLSLLLAPSPLNFNAKSVKSILNFSKFRQCGRYRIHAVSSDEGEAKAESARVKKPVVIRRKKENVSESQVQENLQSLSVEDPSVSVEGVAKVDRNDNQTSDILRLALLAGGDVAFILLFAWIGRATHVSAAIDWELVKTADPFISGWITSAYFLKDYEPNRKYFSDFKQIIFQTAKVWAVGVPLGIIIRSVAKGQAPAVPFVFVSLISTLILLIGWRILFSKIYSSDNGETTGNKSGNPFEFFELLTSLVRRW